MKNLKTVFFIILVTLVFFGCATQTASIHTYVEPTIRTEDIKTVAFFPIRGARLMTSETRAINQMLIDSFSAKNPQVTIINPEESVRLLSDAGLTEEYTDFLTDYSMSGIANASLLNKIGDSLGVDAFLQGELLDIFQQDAVFDVNKGRTSLTVSYTLWSCSEGVLVWEATSQAAKTTITTLGSAPNLYDVVLIAHNKILNSLPLLGE